MIAVYVFRSYEPTLRFTVPVTRHVYISINHRYICIKQQYVVLHVCGINENRVCGLTQFIDHQRVLFSMLLFLYVSRIPMPWSRLSAGGGRKVVTVASIDFFWINYHNNY